MANCSATRRSASEVYPSTERAGELLWGIALTLASLPGCWYAPGLVNGCTASGVSARLKLGSERACVQNAPFACVCACGFECVAYQEVDVVLRKKARAK